MTKLKVLFLFIFLMAVGFNATGQRKDEKIQYIGILECTMGFGRQTDTVSATVFFAHDSFVLVYMIMTDADYRYPLYKGTWELEVVPDTSKVSLKFDNGAVRSCEFVDYGTFYCFELDGMTFGRMTRTTRRRKK